MHLDPRWLSFVFSQSRFVVANLVFSVDQITFDGDRTVKEFVRFLKKEAAIPFTVPKKQSEPAESTPEAEAEPELESVIQDSWNSMKDEL